LYGLWLTIVPVLSVANKYFHFFAGRRFVAGDKPVGSQLQFRILVTPLPSLRLFMAATGGWTLACRPDVLKFTKYR
jgi:hypothetical protein